MPCELAESALRTTAAEEGGGGTGRDEPRREEGAAPGAPGLGGASGAGWFWVVRRRERAGWCWGAPQTDRGVGAEPRAARGDERGSGAQAAIGGVQRLVRLVV